MTNQAVVFTIFLCLEDPIKTIFDPQAVVSTMCQPQYESSVADADILISAKVIKVTKHLYLYLAV